MKSELNYRCNEYYSEIELFRTMAEILKSTYYTTFINETHKHLVTFSSSTIIKDNEVSREISDLWIITYSPSQLKIKMTFLQAKFHKEKVTSPFEFKGEYFQYELLSRCPDIRNAGRKYNLPTNILSFTINKSIGTYGVFYIDDERKIDLAFSIAASLRPNKTATANKDTNVKLTFNHNESYLVDSLEATLNIDLFVKELINLNIGAEIQDRKDILAVVKKSLSTQISNSVVTDFFSFINGFNVGRSDCDGYHKNIMVINVDPIRQ